MFCSSLMPGLRLRFARASRALVAGFAMACVAGTAAWAQGASKPQRDDDAVQARKVAKAAAQPASTATSSGRPEARKAQAPRPQASRESAQRQAARQARQNRDSSARVARAQGQRAAPARPTHAQLAGLRGSGDPLALKSSVVLVVDQDTREVLLSKNDSAVLPIASLTKLMTGLLISEAQLPLDEMITITQDDVDTEKGTSSRLTIGASLSRGELLHLALMSSENRAAHALGRTYPGGLDVFVRQMNQRARQLGMNDTRYVEPTGLSSRNQSSAQDLATLVAVTAEDPMLRELSTSPGHQVALGSRVLQFNNTNRLVKNPTWDIALQKTGYISEAGQCLVMQARVAGRKLIMVFLDSAGKLSRLGDAERVRRWVEARAEPVRG